MREAGATCPACGAPVTAPLGGVLCPACLVALALDEDDADRDAAPGTPAHSYQVVSVIGRSPGRVCYLARRQDFHALVSLEIIAGAELAQLGRPALDGRLAQLRALRHPAIARVLEAWPEPTGDWCVVSDYLAGRSLAAGGQAVDVLGAVDSICEALAAAHGQGVAHGRFDAGSVVLVATGAGLEPRLVGFTLAGVVATVADDVAALGTLVATLAAGRSFAVAAARLAVRAASGDVATVKDFQAALRAFE
jgi:hypothetical protein